MNERIADILFLSQKTVETYRSHLMQKLGINDLPSLVKFAIQHGLTSMPFTVTLVAGFWSGLVSAYASTIGVILPAFVPMAPDLWLKSGAPIFWDCFPVSSSADM